MPNIKVLKFDDNLLSSEGLSAIFEIEGLRSLKILSVQGNDLKNANVIGPKNDLKDPEDQVSFMCLEVLNVSRNKKVS